MISRNKLKFPGNVLPLIWFLSTTGYYLLMIFMLEFGLSTQTRLMTVPARFIPMLLAFIYLRKYKSFFFKNKLITTLWIWMMLFYSIRMLYDLNFENFTFFFSDINYYLYVLTSLIIPPIAMSIQWDEIAWEKAKKWVLFGSISVSILGFVFYREAFSEFGRIKGITDEYATISPLAISYTSLISFSYFLLRIIKNPNNSNKTTSIIGLLLSAPGLLLGSSRGSILALVVVLVLILIAKKYRMRLMITIIVISVSFPILLQFSNSFGSVLLHRVVNTLFEVQSGEYFETDRPYLWKIAIENFLSSPFIGDLIENRGIGHHPHNIIIEAFMSMGLLGGIPFLIILAYLWKLFFKIARHTNKFDWVLIVFGISFMQNMVTGAIWGAVWLWTSAGALISLNHYLINKNGSEQ